MSSRTRTSLALRRRLVPVLICCALYVSDSSAQVVVIAHPTVPLDTLSRSDLIDYYTGDISLWPDETEVILLDLKPRSTAKKAFYKFLGKRPSRLKSIWMKRMLSGEGDPPEALKSESKILEKVASTPGALSYISKSTVTERVKTLLVIPQKE